MNAAVKEWVKKAEADYGVMVREAKLMKEPDPICFHAQQCIEKYAKGFLQMHAVAFARTHNMEYL